MASELPGVRENTVLSLAFSTRVISARSNRKLPNHAVHQTGARVARPGW